MQADAPCTCGITAHVCRLNFPAPTREAVKDHSSPPRHPQAASILVGFLGCCFQASTEAEMAHELQE